MYNLFGSLILLVVNLCDSIIISNNSCWVSETPSMRVTPEPKIGMHPVPKNRMRKTAVRVLALAAEAFNYILIR